MASDAVTNPRNAIAREHGRLLERDWLIELRLSFGWSKNESKNGMRNQTAGQHIIRLSLVLSCVPGKRPASPERSPQNSPPSLER
jgi:hypothetical protein